MRIVVVHTILGNKNRSLRTQWQSFGLENLESKRSEKRMHTGLSASTNEGKPSRPFKHGDRLRVLIIFSQLGYSRKADSSDSPSETAHFTCVENTNLITVHRSHKKHQEPLSPQTVFGQHSHDQQQGSEAIEARGQAN